MIDMGVEPYLVGSTIEGVMAQRLVRTICKDCKVEDVHAEEHLLPNDFPKSKDGGRPKLYKGCWLPGLPRHRLSWPNWNLRVTRHR